MTQGLTRALDRTTEALGSIPAILIVVALTIAWAAAGWFVPGGRWLNDTFQLVTTAAISFITWWMVHAIEFTQNRSDRAQQTKMDAQSEALASILRHLQLDDPALLEQLVGVEDLTEDEIESRQQHVRDRSSDARL